MRKKIISPAAVIGVLALAVGVWIGNSRQAPVAAPSSAPVAAAPRAATDTARGTTFVPIAPCRMVDTRRKGGSIHPGSLRYFRATGTTGFAAQGGAACGIPAAAKAIQASIVSTDATGTGFLKAWAGGTAEPAASFLTIARGVPQRASGTIGIAGSSARAFRLATYTHSTDVTVDVTGYYIGQLWAHVNPDGSIVASSRTTAVSVSGTSAYEVEFDRSVVGCAFQVTPEAESATPLAYPFPDNTHAVYIAIKDPNTGNTFASAFSVFVSC